MVRRQKTDTRDAEHLLDLLLNNQFHFLAWAS
jgi:hypothetical protein